MSKPKKIPLIKTVMTAFPYSIEASEPLSAATKMMESHNIHHLPVTDDGAFVSVITARDVKFAMAKRDDDSDAPALTIASVCEDEVYVVDLNSRLDYVLFEMAEKRIGSAVVLKADKLAGIFTVSDACRTFAEFLQLMFPDGDGDIAA